MLTFSYQIVHGVGGQALTTGTLYIADLENAKRHVQTVCAPGMTPQSGLEVILQDPFGSEIWRGPYLGTLLRR